MSRRLQSEAPRTLRTLPRFRLIGYLISGVLVIVLLSYVDIREVGRLLARVDGSRALIAALVIVADRMLMVYKWHLLLRRHLPGVGLYEAFCAYCVSWSVRLVIPVAVAPEVARAVLIGRPRAQESTVGASILLERLLGAIASGVLVLAALGVASSSRVGGSLAIAIWTLGGLSLCFAALVLPRVLPNWSRLSSLTRALRGWPGARFVGRMAAAFAGYRAPRLLWHAGALSVLEQMLRIMIWWLLARSLHVDIGLAPLFIVMPLSWVVTRLPISVSGIGVLEGVLVSLLGLYGVAPHQVIAVALLHRFYELILALPGAVLWIGMGRRSFASRGHLNLDAPVVPRESETVPFAKSAAIDLGGQSVAS